MTEKVRERSLMPLVFWPLLGLLVLAYCGSERILRNHCYRFEADALTTENIPEIARRPLEVMIRRYDLRTALATAPAEKNKGKRLELLHELALTYEGSKRLELLEQITREFPHSTNNMVTEAQTAVCAGKPPKQAVAAYTNYVRGCKSKNKAVTARLWCSGFHMVRRLEDDEAMLDYLIALLNSDLVHADLTDMYEELESLVIQQGKTELIEKTRKRAKTCREQQLRAFDREQSKGKKKKKKG